MNIFIYLLKRFFYRILKFLDRYYLKSFVWGVYQLINFLERLDKTFALRISFKNLFKPLYQNYTFFGYLFGFFFRGLRIGISILIYGIIILFALFVYLIWAGLPVFIIYKIISNQ